MHQWHEHQINKLRIQNPKLIHKSMKVATMVNLEIFHADPTDGRITLDRTARQ